MNTFKELQVWQKAHRLVVETYELTRRFPSEERYGLVPLAGVLACVLFAVCCVLPFSAAQQTNGLVTIHQDMLTAAGERIGGGNPMRVITSLGQSFGETMSGATGSIVSGYQPSLPPVPPGSRTITLLGAVNEPAAVKVNGASAAVDPAGNFSAPVTLLEGPNTITVVATDPAGHASTSTLNVTLDTRPPAMPTVVSLPTITTATSHTLSGTKTPGTSIWISAEGGSASGGNGVEVVPLSDATTWTVTLPLVEGDNALVIVTKDAAGNPSATVTRTIVVDNLPPIITNVTYTDPQGAALRVDPATNLPKTNFTAVTIAGQVDDRLTTVVINGTSAARTGRTFQVTLLVAALGPNAFGLTATSPNAHVTTAAWTVARGTIPTLQAVQPPDGTLAYAMTSTTIQSTATDSENDAVSLQGSVGGAALGTWGASNAQSWLPTLANLGLHTIIVSVRDNYGGSNAQSVELFVVRPPVQHP